MPKIEFWGPKIDLAIFRNIAQKKAKINKPEKKCRSLARTKKIELRTDKSDYLVDVNKPSSTASEVTMSISSAALNVIFKPTPSISVLNYH